MIQHVRMSAFRIPPSALFDATVHTKYRTSAAYYSPDDIPIRRDFVIRSNASNLTSTATLMQHGVLLYWNRTHLTPLVSQGSWIYWYG